MATPARKRKGPYFLTSGPLGERARARQLGIRWTKGAPLRHGDVTRKMIDQVSEVTDPVRTGMMSRREALQALSKAGILPKRPSKRVILTHPALREVREAWINGQPIAESNRQEARLIEDMIESKNREENRLRANLTHPDPEAVLRMQDEIISLREQLTEVRRRLRNFEQGF